MKRISTLALLLALGALGWAQRTDIPTPDDRMFAQSPQEQPAGAPPTGAPASQATAAPQGAGDEEPITTIRVAANEVNVVFTVTDKRGRFVKDLAKEDFRVLDDNRPVSNISAFSRQTDLPLRVGLLIDASNSIRDRFTFEQEAAIEFLHQIVRRGSDKAFVLGFDVVAEVTQDFTDDVDKLSKGVRMLRPGGGTAVWDAIYFASRDKLMKEYGAGGPIRRAIIVLSDGEDNQSRVTREEAIEMAQRAEIIIYGISTNVSGSKSRGDDYLKRVAEATGGRAFFPFKIQDVSDAFSDIQDELRSQYVLSYKPDNLVADGRFRSIQIETQNNKKNLRVRARKGYFAPGR